MFQRELWVDYKLIDVYFAKHNTTGVYRSWVKYQWPKGHITNTSSSNALHLNNHCGKIFTLENGTTNTYMGLEHHLLKLLAEKYPIESINTYIYMLIRQEEVTIFSYVFEDTPHNYLADIFVHIANTFRRWYEVKSTWTLNGCGKDPKLGRKNMEKWKAVSKAEGVPFDVFVFNRYGKISSCDSSPIVL